MSTVLSWLLLIALLELAYQLGKRWERQRYPGAYKYECPLCHWRTSTDHQPTFNWAVYKHQENLHVEVRDG